MIKNILIALTMTAALSACKSNDLQTAQIDAEAAEQAASINVSADQMVLETQNQMSQAAIAELNYYTPLHFANVSDKMKNIEALQSESGKDNDVEIITESIKIQKLLEESYLLKETILTTLAPSFENKKVLADLGSDKEFPSDFQKIDKSLMDIFREIERGNMDKALSSQVSLLEDMEDLEKETLIKKYIVPAESILNQAEDEDADTYAEVTFDKAEEIVERSEEFIKTNYRNREEVRKAGESALLAAKKALHTGTLAKGMFELDEEASELKAIEMEKLVDSISESLGLTHETDGLDIKEKVKLISSSQNASEPNQS